MTQIKLSAARAYDLFLILASTAPKEHEALKPGEPHKSAYWADKIKGKFEEAAKDYSDLVSEVNNLLDEKRPVLLKNIAAWKETHKGEVDFDNKLEVFKAKQDADFSDMYKDISKEKGLEEAGKKEVVIEFERDSHMEYLKQYVKKFLHEKMRVSSAYLEMMNAICGEPTE